MSASFMIQEFIIGGMSSLLCVEKIQSHLLSCPGIIKAEVNYRKKKLIIETAHHISVNELQQVISKPGHYFIRKEIKPKSETDGSFFEWIKKFF